MPTALHSMHQAQPQVRNATTDIMK
jgi:hypothetical protein